MTPDELATMKAWEARATPGPWEQGIAYLEAPVNPGESAWATWRDRDEVEPDLMWQVKHLPVGQCRLCEDGPPLSEVERDTRVALYRHWDSRQSKDYVGESTRRVTYHVHRVARARVNRLEPISSRPAMRAVLDVVTGEEAEDGRAQLLLSSEDASFISHARTAVPELLAEIERLQERIRQLEARPAQAAEAEAAEKEEA